MKTAMTTLAALLACAAMPATAQETSGPSEAFDKAFGAETEAESQSAAKASLEHYEETVGAWQVFDAPTVDGERRVFMRKELGAERFLEFDMQEGNEVALTLLDPNCGFGLSVPLRELGEDRAAGLAAKYADILDVETCDARAAIPTAEELVEPLARLEAWVAERPFPAASLWKPEERLLTIGKGEGVGIGRYEGNVAIVYLEPGEGATGPAEVIVNIYECAGFDGRTLPVRSGGPAEAQAIAQAVLEERAEACGLAPEAPARLAAGLSEGLAAQKRYQASLREDAARNPDEPYDPEES